MKDGIFHTPREALTFALNFNSNQYNLSPMGRLVEGGPVGSGRGLYGLDGAGQAGMVMRELEALDKRSHYGACALIARCLPHYSPCACGSPCCGGKRPNAAWTEVLGELTDYVVQFLGTGLSNRALRRAIVEKHFGRKVSIDEIADDCGVHRNTASKQVAAIRKGLKELEARAWEDWDIRIAEIGMLTEETTA